MKLSTIGQQATMSSREIASLVEKQHSNIKISAERLAERGVIALQETPYIEPQNKQTYTEYLFSKRDSLILVAQNCPEFTARIVDRWQELESKQSISLPNFSNPAEAARAWALEYEARLLAEQTKAQIGHRREATAMNTASQAVKKATKLEIELDRSKQYATVKRMEMLYHGQKFQWRLLKSTGIEMGIDTIDVFDQNYGTVKAYHADVWLEAYAIDVDGYVQQWIEA